MEQGVGARCLAALLSSMASAVELAPAPAMTGTRLAATSTTRRMTATCSLTLSVADSPVVPTATRP